MRSRVASVVALILLPFMLCGARAVRGDAVHLGFLVQDLIENSSSREVILAS
jgi:hypothetical protein